MFKSVSGSDTLLSALTYSHLGHRCYEIILTAFFSCEQMLRGVGKFLKNVALKCVVTRVTEIVTGNNINEI